MKIYTLLSFLVILLTTTNNCSKNNSVYKGRLEVKGMCMNYTIKLLKGDPDTSMIVSKWKDESTGKTHKNVFALGSACTFPSAINEGDEFYFTIDSTYKPDCAVCLAYYPKPKKSIAIKVVEK